MAKTKPTKKQLAQSGIMMPDGYDDFETPAQRMRATLGPEHGGDAKPAPSKKSGSKTSESKTKKSEPTDNTAAEGPPEDGSGEGPPEDSGAALEPWMLKTSPTEYIETYGKNKPSSALALKYIEAGQGDVTAK